MKSIQKTLLTAFVMLSAIWGQSQNVAATQTNASSLSDVYNHYFAIRDALVKSDAKTASEKSKHFIAALAAVNTESLSASEKPVWKQMLTDLNNDAKSISETQDIKHQRELFKSLSKNTYELIKVSKQSETIYYNHCPMVDANWLSKESAIKNPYYGSQMLSCGKTIETIK